MKRRIFPIVLAVLLSGCSDTRINDLEHKLNSELGQMRQEIAQQSNQLEELRSEVGRVTGKVEEVQHVASGRTEQIEQTLRRMSSRVPPPPPVPEELLNDDEELISKQQGEAADLFMQGLRELRDGNFSSSRDTFTRFVDDNPTTAFTDNAFFWQGISYEGLGQLDRAVTSFSMGFQKFPAEDRVPANLFKLGDVFEKLGQRKDAELTYEKLVEEYPRSEFAAKAATRISPKKKIVKKPVAATKKKR